MSLDLEQEILNELGRSEPLVTEPFAAKLGVDHQSVVSALNRLTAQDGLVVSAVKTEQRWKLTAEAVDIARDGSPEFALWTLLAGGPMEQSVINATMGPRADVAMKNGMKSRLFQLSKADGVVTVSRHANATNVTDGTQTTVLAVQQGAHVDPKELDGLKKRKLAQQEPAKFFEVTKGPNFTTTPVKPVSDLTREMLADGSWKTAVWKQFTLEKAQGKEPAGGQLHPLLKVRQEFREIFLELGFQEMDTCDWVESSFWNFDTLFVPQNHPARDAQDTFFISKPAQAQDPEPGYLAATKDVHEDGYSTKWSVEESRRNVLRTHTTAVSSAVLKKLAEAAPLRPDGKRDFVPGKYFSIDRVFRNEEMDKTHLCEFHQVEGFIVDRNLSLANMMHTLNLFFRRIGIEQLRFKPAFNPYTEPSMEIFGFHPGLKRWIEVGNSGVFRPEMLQPMGFDSDVTAIAWGLSLERPTMIKYGISNIHELFGHKVDVKFIKRAKLCRF